MSVAALTATTKPATALTWNWSYSGAGITAGGTFTTVDMPDGSGFYLITGIAGVRNDAAILGLQPAGTPIPGNEPFSVDNLVRLESPQLTVHGFGYAIAGGTFSNPFFANFLQPPEYLEFFSAPPLTPGVKGPEDSELPIRFSAIRAPVPQTATWALLLAGLGMLARFVAPAPGLLDPDPHPRWLPPVDGSLWNVRKRKVEGTYIPWGMIGGEKAGIGSSGTGTGATNEADHVTGCMHNGGMVFNGDVTSNDIATYTHGMIQAIYKAYVLGPNCEPYEIAVGSVTKKMASCLPCTLFMSATGYPPTSIHLGRGESWAPLYQPYNPNGPTGEHELAVIRDLNNAWYEKCLEWLEMGLEMLDDRHITDDHKASRDAVSQYFSTNSKDKTVAGVLILDAVTVHEGEMERIGRTLK